MLEAEVLVIFGNADDALVEDRVGEIVVLELLLIALDIGKAVVAAWEEERLALDDAILETFDDVGNGMVEDMLAEGEILELLLDVLEGEEEAATA